MDDKNPTLKRGGRCVAKEPSTCTPLSAPGSSQAMPKEGSLIMGGILPPRSNLLPSWTLPSSMDVAITPPHLPPPGASLTFRICFPLLRSSERCCRVGVPRGRAGVAGSTWGRLRVWTPDPSLITRLTSLPSVTATPVLGVFLRFLGKQMQRVAFRRLSDSCTLTSPPFHPCLSTC